MATVSAYDGSSPEPPDVALLHSANKSHQITASDNRYEAMLKTASNMLLHPDSYRTEKLALGKVAGNDNGHCEVIYEYFDCRHYPEWLTELRKYSYEGVCCTLLREYDKDHRSVVRSEVLRGSTNKYLTASQHPDRLDCFLQNTGSSLLLLRTIRSDTIAITLVGDHPVADEIQKQSAHLPINITRINSVENHPLDNSIIIIMTADHELDYQHCESILKKLNRQDAFIGCIGSVKKADIFKSRLLQNGVSEKQLNQLHMPVGIPEISGKQKSVVAASIVAQILMRHQW